MRTFTAKERFAYLMYNRPPVGMVKTKQMETLKLQVDKTYRDRKGEEVRIIEEIRDGIDSYKGDNDRLYTESGRFLFYAGESLLDLIEEVEKEEK